MPDTPGRMLVKPQSKLTGAICRPVYTIKRHLPPPPLLLYSSSLPHTWERNFNIDLHLLQNNLAAIFVLCLKKKVLCYSIVATTAGSTRCVTFQLMFSCSRLRCPAWVKHLPCLPCSNKKKKTTAEVRSLHSTVLFAWKAGGGTKRLGLCALLCLWCYAWNLGWGILVNGTARSSRHVLPSMLWPQVLFKSLIYHES